jgi:excinuclease ABC subunit C
MGRRTFDKKFGSVLTASLPTGPGIYLFRNAERVVLYVGKAKNLKRRLQNYRNASRNKLHRKMRTLVREASSLEVRSLKSECEALLEENALIRDLKPPYNVDGAFAFLYPAIGIGVKNGHTLLCFSTKPEAYAGLKLRWFGVFRSRPRAKAAFDALVELLAFIGHLNKRTQLPAHESGRGSRLVSLRQLPRDLAAGMGLFLGGQDRTLLTELSAALLAKPRARHDATRVEENLHLLDDFYKADTRKLRLAMERLGHTDSYVPQDDRDSLFISARFESNPPNQTESS